MIIASYLEEDPRRESSLSCLLASLQSQTYQKWEAIVVHDGPLHREIGPVLSSILADHRIRFVCSPERKNDYGHSWRRWGADMSSGDYIGMSNDDNYYVPVYFEWMLSELVSHGARLVYCDMVHSHKLWQPLKSMARKGGVDVGSWIAAADLVKSTEWTDFGFTGDWTFFERLHQRAGKVRKLPATLFVHN